MNKSEWTQDKHKAFLTGEEKYGNIWNEIATIVFTHTPVQIKKNAECHFKQNLKTNAAAVQQHQESLSPNKKAQIWSIMLRHIKNIESPSLPITKPKCYRMMLMHTENIGSPFLPRKKPDF